MTVKTQYVNVAVPIHSHKEFTYLVPENLRSRIEVGSEVLVSLGNRRVSGFVVGYAEGPVPGVKEILGLVCERPLFTKELLELTSWLADYYMSSWGEALRAAVPAGVGARERSYVQYLGISPPGLGEHEKRVLDEIASRGRISEKRLARLFPDLDTKGVVRNLRRRGAVSLSSSLVPSALEPTTEMFVILLETGERPETTEGFRARAPKQASILEYLERTPDRRASIEELRHATLGALSSVRALEKKGLVRIERREKVLDPTRGIDVNVTRPARLTHYQAHALTLIEDHLKRSIFRTALLFGVTGSGKTEVYLRAAAAASKMGRQSIVLVPEISLTPQTASRFISRFGPRVAVLHSRLSTRERSEIWRRIGEGDFDIVIGPRSAVFAPLKKLGLLVVDEEHDPSYKQSDQIPRYNARDVAVMRARVENCVCILGSATPSLESFHNAVSDRYDLLVLPERVDGRPMPAVEVIDMKSEKDPVFSESLRNKIALRIERGEQVILFLNRRGFSRFVLCRDCGHVEACPRCSVSLTYHKAQDALVCHYCGFKRKVYDICPRCRSTKLLTKGLGTEKVEKALKNAFPQVRVLRMDMDTTRARHAHRDIFQSFMRHEADVLLGTQMITKGFDFPLVTLVGVISADTSLNAPDLRSAERTLQLLTQVAGRTGRSGLGGEVVIQTFSPELEIIRTAAAQEYKSFYETESIERRELSYPPFSRMVNITVGSTDSLLAQTTAEKLKKAIQNKIGKNGGGLLLLGPAPAPVFRLKGSYRYRILLKAKKPMQAQRILGPILAGWSAPRKVRLAVDVDPVEVL